MDTITVDEQAPKTDKEWQRLEKLASLDLDYQELEQHLGDLTRLAARIADTEISLINLIDNFTQWTVSSQGLQLNQMPREESVCQFTILEPDQLEIKDLSEDERFKDRNYVKKGPGLRYYYGVPLKTSSGLPIGVLCVMDKQQQSISSNKRELLTLIGNEVVRRLEMISELKTKQDNINALREINYKISHDLRNPISGMIGVADLIEEEIAEENYESILELVSIIKDGAESVIAMVEKIMGDCTSQDDKENGPKYSCSSFCEKLMELYHPQAKSKGVDLDISTSVKTEVITFSRSKLLQIVGNLVSNSIKFTPEGGEVSVELHLNEQVESEHELVVNVKDSGVGMDQETIDQISQGTAVSTHGTVGENGYGFGLTLVKHLLDEAGGSLHISSYKHVGTEFNVTIPLN
ncbi:GAF domain-containing sensor histidine kinase [Balneolaceae bacterium YR4-1]|uniref:histidine kinase n=1 Tax=Halalkalibaculum roseum TaxID=2709311 RepID=A0A6M1SKS2_9BACT|nr:GAF domain-containing sensor histidine kinase [Halalkalibaculum roseum]NGP75599.1 GAF domain-containing sensor histidine kinase [Halalkalibaculum roseum]